MKNFFENVYIFIKVLVIACFIEGAVLGLAKLVILLPAFMPADPSLDTATWLVALVILNVILIACCFFRAVMNDYREHMKEVDKYPARHFPNGRS